MCIRELLKKWEELAAIEETPDLEGKVVKVVATGESDLKFSSLPPLPKHGMYFREGETIRYWVDLEYEGGTYRKEFTERPAVTIGQDALYSHDPKKGSILTPYSEKQ